MFSEWSQPFAHLDPGAPADHKLILRFREGTVRNERLSAEGPSVYDRVLQVQVHAVGQRNSAPIYTLLKITEGKEKIEEPREYQRFRQAFDQWRANIEPTHDGMPLEHWPLMTVELVRAFKDANIFSVEQLADAPDSAANNVRAPFYDFRAKAKAWLSDAKAKGGDAKARSDLAKAQREIEELRTQVAQLLAVQNGASPRGFDKPKRKKGNGEAVEAPISIPDDALEEFEDRI